MNKITTHATAALIATRTVAMMILATPIRQDAEGRYCLNDLHAAAGAQKRHSPNYFIHLDTSKEMIADIESTGFPVVKAVETHMGRAGGTYVHEDLALDYAGWISASFRREVYRTFKESRKTQPTDMGTAVAPAGAPLSTLLRMASEAVAEKERLELQIEAERPRVAFANAVEADESTRTIRETAKQFGLSDQRLTALLIEKKLLYRAAHPRGGQAQVLPYQQFIDDESFVVRTYAVSHDHVRSRTQITGKGVMRIHRLLSQKHLN
jgi:anti-repressor protein